MFKTKQTLRTITILSLSALSLSILTSCESAKQLKDIKSIAVVGISYSKVVESLDENHNKIGNMNYSERAKKQGVTIDKNVKKYYNTIAGGLFKVLKNEGYTIKKASQLRKTPTLKHLKYEKKSKKNQSLIPGYLPGTTHQDNSINPNIS